MSWRCRLAATVLLAREPADDLPRLVAGHVAECLSCQAEAARYRKLRRVVASLAGEVVSAPPWLGAELGSVLRSGSVLRVPSHALGGGAPSGAVGRLAATGAAVAVTAAVAGVAAALWRRGWQTY